MVNGESKVIKSEFSEGLILDESNSKKNQIYFPY